MHLIMNTQSLCILHELCLFVIFFLVTLTYCFIKRVIDSQAEKLKELDKEIRPFRQNWEEADSMKSSVESLQNRVTELESVDKTAGQGARNTSKCKHNGLKYLAVLQKEKGYPLNASFVIIFLWKHSDSCDSCIGNDTVTSVL